MSRSLKSRSSSKEWGFESDFSSRRNKPRFRSSQDKEEGDVADCWLLKHAPNTKSELALHKKKLEAVERVLTDTLTHPHPKVVVLSGPPGVGKSATVRALARDLGCAVEEWSNPIMTYEKGVYYESEVSKFRSFLLSSSRYNSLFDEERKVRNPQSRKLVLVEELPNFVYRHPADFWDTIKTYSKSGVFPVVLVISDSSTKVRVPPEYLNIQFNPVANTIMTRALRNICQKEKVSEENVEEIVETSEGDLRNAILSLRFNSVNSVNSVNSEGCKVNNKRRKVDKVRDGAKKKKSSKDSTLFIFHALGKLLYAKRDGSSELDTPEPGLGRRRLEFLPEEVAEKCAVSSGLITQYLHHNFLGFQNEIDNTVLQLELMCDSDIVTSHFTTDRDVLDRLEWYGKSLTSRAIVFSKDQTFQPKFMPLCRSVQKDIQNTATENRLKCRDNFPLLHMGATTCFLLDTMPFLKKIGFKSDNPGQHSLIQQLTHFKSSSKCGASLTNKDAIHEDNDEILCSTNLNEDQDLALSKELENEIHDFSD